MVTNHVRCPFYICKLTKWLCMISTDRRSACNIFGSGMSVFAAVVGPSPVARNAEGGAMFHRLGAVDLRREGARKQCSTDGDGIDQPSIRQNQTVVALRKRGTLPAQ
ncbi:hypothetical protein JKG47_11670 [Acidithiobacillus sp. MC6.1]|uniref:Uncharacterized protein n=2 Tax=Acidithiobacillus ferrivorans TaxID=160808 RepID=A0A1B9BVR7_9PROT|nr:hypothetical protein [Acidithiobacillus sp. MC6.1]OCB01815.1 hypothetical protein BBC27_01980 [Acidithiobacillus ferrivorans]